MDTFQDINGLDRGQPIGASPDGLGVYLRPIGDDGIVAAPSQSTAPVSSGLRRTLIAAHAIASIAGTGLGAYHGYKRNESVGWAIGWAFFGTILPVIAIPVMFAQGMGRRK